MCLRRRKSTDLPLGMLQSDRQLGEDVLPVDVCRESVLPDHVLPDGRQFQVTMVTGPELLWCRHWFGRREPDVRVQQRGGALHGRARELLGRRLKSKSLTESSSLYPTAARTVLACTFILFSYFSSCVVSCYDVRLATEITVVVRGNDHAAAYERITPGGCRRSLSSRQHTYDEGNDTRYFGTPIHTSGDRRTRRRGLSVVAARTFVLFCSDV